MNELVPRSAALSETFPALLQRAGKNALFAADEFFSAKISNPHTRRAYARPVGRVTPHFTETRRREGDYEVCQKHGIADQTFYRWQSKYSGLQVSEAKKLKELEIESRNLKWWKNPYRDLQTSDHREDGVLRSERCDPAHVQRAPRC